MHFYMHHFMSLVKIPELTDHIIHHYEDLEQCLNKIELSKINKIQVKDRV